MKLIFFTIFYLIVYFPVAVLSYILFEQEVFVAFSLIAMTIWFVVFLYIDRILLLFLGAREVIDTDEHHFFQILKNNAYKNRVNLPRIYVYDGNIESCFLFESFKSWTVVLDKKLLSRLSEESLEKLVELVYRYHIKEGHGFIKTKAMGISVLHNMCIYWLIKTLFLQKTKSRYFKAVMTFVILMTKPFLYPFDFILKLNSKVPGDITLQQLSLRVESQDVFAEYIQGLVVENKRFKDIIVKYIEGYPLFLECEFKNEF